MKSNSNSQSHQPYAIHWFRRDLRLVGNTILQNALERFEGRVLCVFCFDQAFLSRPDFSWSRFLFFLKTLEDLKAQIESLGGTFFFLNEAPKEAIPAWLEKIISQKGKPGQFSWNRDYEPFALSRDSAMEGRLSTQFGIDVVTARDHLLIEPNELVKGASAEGDSFYQVFTPFKRKWLQIFLTPEIQNRIREVEKGLKQKPRRFSEDFSDECRVLLKGKFDPQVLETYIKTAAEKVSIPLPTVGFEQALKQVLFFGQKKIEGYAVDRDIPSVSGTSQVSIYLKSGTITVPQLITLLKLNPQDESRIKYFNELIWREFYYHILAHFPRVEYGCFNQKYDQLKWENSKKYFEAWKKGETGYPIIDAGMRQLNATGWMHNRVRMIVASFLTKDLLIDWKWGEKYFMEKLLDGDLAPNNGGWQWAASTGCDAQPYFRIFNPTLQAERFDPENKYILKWAPEYAARTDGLEVHMPYRPIVEHAVQKIKAVDLFRDVRKNNT